MKKCPYCAEEIQDDATICQNCGKEIPHATLPVPGVQPQEIKASVLVSDNGLGKAEREWFEAQANAVNKGLLAMAEDLHAIRGWMTFIGILIIVGLVVTILRGCL